MRQVPVEEQVHFLALLDSISKRFDNSTLEKRIEMQKLVYLGQSYGLNLNYEFKWNARGPYSTMLADVGYAIEKYHGVEELSAKVKSYPLDKLTDNLQTLDRFRDAVQPYLNDDVRLEIAGSLVWVKRKHYTNVPLEQCRDSLIRDVAYVYKKFEPLLVMHVLERLEEFDLIPA